MLMVDNIVPVTAPSCEIQIGWEIYETMIEIVLR